MYLKHIQFWAHLTTVNSNTILKNELKKKMKKQIKVREKV